MFVYTVKIKWWRVVCFILLTGVVCTAVYYMTRHIPAQSRPAPPEKEQEGQVWQV